MPRPTNAQVAYGSLTVVVFTFAMLLLTHARSGAGVAAVAAGGLACGLLVVAGAATQSRRAAATASTAHSTAPSAAARSSAAPLTSLAPVPRARVRAGAAGRRVGEHSLRR
jgi:hypothetical protein